MGAGKTAVVNAKQLVKEVCDIAASLKLVAKERVPAGRTVWATDRRIKVVLEYAPNKKKEPRRLGVECFCQDGPGTANQKFFAKVEDTKHWPMDGVVVYGGKGFSPEFEGVMNTYGAVPLEGLKTWLKTYFNMK